MLIQMNANEHTEAWIKAQAECAWWEWRQEEQDIVLEDDTAIIAPETLSPRSGGIPTEFTRDDFLRGLGKVSRKIRK